MYPIGIPLLYAYILWKNRESLNPSQALKEFPRPESESEGEAAESGGRSLPNEPEGLKEKLEKRRQNPDLVPSMFLWKDFGEMRVVRAFGHRLAVDVWRQMHRAHDSPGTPRTESW